MGINRESIGKFAFRCTAIAILLVLPALSQAQTRTVLVSPVPGDPVASGNALRSALAGIQSPSNSNRWLLKVEPGVYDVQGTSLVMRPWVSIEGSGIEATTIRGNAPTLFSPNPPFIFPNGTVNGADNTELRNLTVEASANGVNLIAMLNRDASPRVYRVRFITQGNSTLWGMLNMGAGTGPILDEIEVRVTGGPFPTGIEYQSTEVLSEIKRSRIVVLGGTTQGQGIMLASGKLYTIKDTEIETYFGASASGIYVQSAPAGQELMLSNVTITSASSTQANYGINCNDALNLRVFGSQILVDGQFQRIGIRQVQTTGVTNVRNSHIRGATSVVTSGGPVSISHSDLIGGPVTGSFKACYGVVDEAGVFYTNPCPP